MKTNALFCRTYQAVFSIGVKLLPWPVPECITGEGSLSHLPRILQKYGSKKPLIVASKRQSSDPLFLRAVEGLSYALYTGVAPNPTVDMVEEIASLYRSENCDGFVAIGGGSPMDAAKAAAARLVRPNKAVPQLRGLFKVCRKIPPFIAVPTTAGTGSETTIAAVITDNEHHKYPINDPFLVPKCAILDPSLTVTLPANTTAETGMDALTHAVEAYTNRFYNTRFTRRMAEEAVRDIFTYLPRAVAQGGDIEARERLLVASFKAGAAFTRSCVGNVHAMAHTIGGLYGKGHGLCNAILLPILLRDYGSSVKHNLDRLAHIVGLADADAFIGAIEDMNHTFGIPDGFTCIQEEDIPQMAAWANAEANPLYPVPKIYSASDLASLFRKVMR